MDSAHNTDTSKAAEKTNPKEKGYVRGFVSNVNPGYAVAGAAALWTSVLSIDKDLNEILRMNGRTDPFYAEAKKAYQKVYEWKEISDVEKEKLATAVKQERDHPGRIAKWIQECINERLKEDGIHNSWEKFERLRPYQQQQKIATFATVIAIGAGALYSYATSRSLAEKLRHQRAENAELKSEMSGQGAGRQ